MLAYSSQIFVFGQQKCVKLLYCIKEILFGFSIKRKELLKSFKNSKWY